MSSSSSKTTAQRVQEELEKVGFAASSTLRANGSHMAMLHVIGEKDDQEFVAILGLGFPMPPSGPQREELFTHLGANFSGSVGRLELVIHIHEAWMWLGNALGEKDESTKQEVLIVSVSSATDDVRGLRIYKMTRDGLGALEGVELHSSIVGTASVDLEDNLGNAFIRGYQMPSAVSSSSSGGVGGQLAAINLGTGEVADFDDLHRLSESHDARRLAQQQQDEAWADFE